MLANLSVEWVCTLREVSSGGVGGGVVSDYLAINLSLDENGGKSKERTGYDGLLKEVTQSDVDQTNNKVKDDATATYKYEEHLERIRGVLSRAYGRKDGSQSGRSGAKILEYATFWDIVNASNSQSGDILSKVAKWASIPGQESLDGLFAYEFVHSGVRAAPQPANGDAFALAVAPESRIERKWFQNLATVDDAEKSPLLFKAERSNDALAASRIPDIELKSTYSSQVDVLIRKLAASPLLAGNTLAAPAGDTQDAQQQADPPSAEKQSAATVQSAAGSSNSAATANRSGTSPANVAEANGLENLRSTLHTRLLSQQTIKLYDNDKQPRTMLQLLGDLWDLYLPSREGEGADFIRKKTVEWLSDKLEKAKAKQLTEQLLPSEVKNSGDNNDATSGGGGK